MGGTSRSGGNRVLGTDSSEPDGLPVKPKLPAKVGKKWDQLLSELPKPALRRIDCHELKILCELLVHSDALAEVMRKDPLDHATGRLFLNVADRIHRLSAAFGLSPADRKRLALPAETEEEDPFVAWLADATGQD